MASAAPSEGIRRDAAALAGAHLATCGALDSPATAAREAGAWVSRLPASPPRGVRAACQFLAEAAGAAARRRGVDADAAANAVQRAPPPVAGWPRAGAGAGSAALPAGATGEDLEFSGLVAGAVAASVKVLGSAKRTRLQRLAVASYVAAVLFDVVQQQEDPIPLATLILCAYRDGQHGTRAPGAGASGGDAGGGTSGAGARRGPGTIPAPAPGVPAPGAPGLSRNLREYPALDSLVAFADVIVNGRPVPVELAPRTRGKKRVPAKNPKPRGGDSNASSAASDAASAAAAEAFLSAPRESLEANPPDPSAPCARLAVAAHGPLLPARLFSGDARGDDASDDVDLASLSDSRGSPVDLAATIGSALARAPRGTTPSE